MHLCTYNVMHKYKRRSYVQRMRDVLMVWPLSNRHVPEFRKMSDEEL